jgi:16S rRNA processing protein RimM
VALVTTLQERLAVGSSLECQGRQLVVESAREVPGKSRLSGGLWVVRFAGVATHEQAEALRGATLEAEPMPGAEGLWVHEVIGSSVVAPDGAALGTVVSVEANPASDLLVLDSGALVPLRFVTGAQPGRLTVDAPPGLFDL